MSCWTTPASYVRIVVAVASTLLADAAAARGCGRLLPHRQVASSPHPSLAPPSSPRRYRSLCATMKVFSLSVIQAPPNKSPTTLVSATDLSSFSFYQRGSVGEFMSFFSKTIAERTPQGQRQSVQENSYTAHVYNRGGAEQLAGEYYGSQ